MKKILFGLLLFGFSSAVHAQETYSISATAQQVSDLTAAVDMNNGKTCLRWNQSVGCNQAQACTGANAAGGSSCTAAQARAAQARIYPQTQAGREEFVTFGIAGPRFIELRDQVPNYLADRSCAFRTTANQTQRDSQCTSSGLTAPCRLCGLQ